MKKIITGIMKMLIIAAVVLLCTVVWITFSSSGISTVANIFRDELSAMSPSVEFGEVGGSVARGLYVTDVRVTLADGTRVSAARMDAAVSLDMPLDMTFPANASVSGLTITSASGKKLLSLAQAAASATLADAAPKRVDASGLKTDADSLREIAAAFPQSDGEKSDFTIKPFDVSLTSSNITLGARRLSISEASLTRSGDVRLVADLDGKPLEIDDHIELDDLSSMSVSSLDVLIGGGKATVSANMRDGVSARLDKISIADLDALAGRNDAVDGKLSGSVRLTLGDVIAADGDITLEALSAGAFPIGSFAIPWSFDGRTLKLSGVTGILPGMKNLRGSAALDIENMTGSASFAGDKLSLSAIQQAFGLAYPVTGDGGSFKLAVNFAEGRASGDIALKLPHLKLAEHRADDVVLNIRLADGKAGANFNAKAFGASVHGNGSIRLEAPYPISASANVKGLDAKVFKTFFPQISDVDPAGSISAEIICSGTVEKPVIKAKLLSDKLTLADTPLGKIAGNLESDGKQADFNLKFTAVGSQISVSGATDLESGALRVSARAPSIDLATIPNLSGVSGKFNAQVDVSGSVSDPRASFSVSSGNGEIAGIKTQKLAVSGSFANNKLTVTECSAVSGKGRVSMNGNVALGGDPIINISGKATDFPLDAGVSGALNAEFKIAGPLSKASINGSVSAAKLNAGDSKIDALKMKFNGTTKQIMFDDISAKISGGELRGAARIAFGRVPIVDAQIFADHVEVRPLLESIKLNIGLGGKLTGDLRVLGPLTKMEAKLTTRFPLTFREMLVDKLEMSLSSPKKWTTAVALKIFMGKLTLALNTIFLRERGGWKIDVNADNTNINDIVLLKAPNLDGQFEGKIKLNGKINMPDKGVPTYTFNVITTRLKAFGIPIVGSRVKINMAGNELTANIERGMIGGGAVHGSAKVDIAKSRWRGNLNAAGISLEEVLRPILEPMGGKMLGTAKFGIDMGGSYGVMPAVYGRGDFSIGEGAIQGLPGLETLNAAKKFEFKSVTCPFAITGTDVSLLHGTEVLPLPGEPFYRYMRFNGPLGILGKGMNVECRTRIDARVFNTLIGAFEGLIGYMAGANVVQNPVRSLAEKLLNIKGVSFSDLTFNLVGGWGSPSITNIKTEKQLSGVYEYGAEEEGESAGKQKTINVQFNIPVGHGGASDDSTNAINQGILDNILDNLIPNPTK